MIQCLVSRNPSSWSEQLLWVEYAHNTLSSSSVSFSVRLQLSTSPIPVSGEGSCQPVCTRLHSSVSTDLDEGSRSVDTSHLSAVDLYARNDSQSPSLSGSCVSDESEGLAHHPGHSSSGGVFQVGNNSSVPSRSR